MQVFALHNTVSSPTSRVYRSRPVSDSSGHATRIGVCAPPLRKNCVRITGPQLELQLSKQSFKPTRLPIGFHSGAIVVTTTTMQSRDSFDRRIQTHLESIHGGAGKCHRYYISQHQRPPHEALQVISMDATKLTPQRATSNRRESAFAIGFLSE